MSGPIHPFSAVGREPAAPRPTAARAVRSGTSSVPGPVLGVVFNPRSHRNQSLRAAIEGLPGVHVASPARRDELGAVLARFARLRVDCIAVSGGDGTVRDVLTAGMPVFGQAWPALAVVPSGKTNALNVDLGAPRDWSVAGVLAALQDGRRVVRRPLRVRDLAGGGELVGFVFGAGIFTTAISAGQDAHRLGAFDSLAVGATAAWGVGQALLGSDRNRWRRGVAMAVRTGKANQPLARSAFGDPARRALLFASTLERFPFGMNPFGDLTGLKLLVLDHPRRRLIAAVPAIVAGWTSPWLVANGVHRLATDRFELSLEDRFILDGEAFPGGSYEITPGPALSFVVP